MAAGEKVDSDGGLTNNNTRMAKMTGSTGSPAPATSVITRTPLVNGASANNVAEVDNGGGLMEEVVEQAACHISFICLSKYYCFPTKTN